MKAQNITRQLVSLSPSFKSQQPRYSTKKISDNSPGPGTYGIPVLDYQKTSKYHVTTEKKSNIKKEFQWIVSNTRAKAFYSTDKNTQIGPGSYDFSDRKSNHQIWSKGIRFQSKGSNTSLPGPGFYNLGEISEVEFKQGAQAVFKSKTPKALFKDIRSSQKEYSHQEKKLYFPIEESCEVEEMVPKKQEKSSFFASKVPRFLTESSHLQVGPGSYELNTDEDKKQDLPKLIRYSHNSQLMAKKMKEKRVYSEVGPGSYNVKKFDLSYDLDWKGQSFSRQTRFNFKHKKHSPFSQIPGPGQYIKEKLAYQSNQSCPKKLNSKCCKGCPVKQMKEFMPAAEGYAEKKTPSTHGPGEYDLNHFNIDFKLKKRLDHKQKLKIMEISMAGFNSKVPRFD